MLSSRRSNLIEVIALHSTHSFFRNTISDISMTAATLGYRVLFSVIAESDLIATLDSSITHMVDGVILITGGKAHSITARQVREGLGRIPFVVLAVKPIATLPTITFDQMAGAALATEHLITLGHEHIAMIAASVRHVGRCVALQRLASSPAIA